MKYVAVRRRHLNPIRLCSHRHLMHTVSQRTVFMSIQSRRNEFESGGTRPARPSCPLHFLALQVGLQLVVFVSAFVMVRTVRSVSRLLFFYSRCPPCPAICKRGRHVPPCHMESAPVYTDTCMCNPPYLKCVINRKH